MRTPLGLIAAIAWAFLFMNTLAFAESLQEVEYVIGPKLFSDNDSISIDSVKASSPDFVIGDTVQVSGTYHLNSLTKAKLSIHVTKIQRDGRTRIQPDQQVLVDRGKGKFQLMLTTLDEGHLHVSFYPHEGGDAFGGIYFGSPEQMDAIQDWTLDCYR